MTQSINIFSAIVEGFQAIQKTSVTHKIELDSTLITRIEKDLISIAQQLENNNMVHIAQTIQFSRLTQERMPRLEVWRLLMRVEQCRCAMESCVIKCGV